MKKLLIISLFVIFSLTGCSSQLMETVPFTLNTEVLGESGEKCILIKSKIDFDSFLANEEIFMPDLSDEFIEVNSKYDTSFFESKYLIALVVQATSGQIEGYKLISQKIEGDTLTITISSYSNEKNVTGDMGGWFTYYLAYNKSSKINSVKLKLK